MGAIIMGGSDNVVRHQRTEKGLAYDRLIQEIKAMPSSSDSDLVAELREMNAEIIASKAAGNAILHNYVLRTISVAYQNDEFIGERLMPTINVNGRLAASYYTYTKRDKLGYPDDTMAERANANELSRTRALQSISLTPRALREFVDELTLNNPEQPLNEIVEATANVLEGINFRREKRIAALVGAAASYGSNTLALAAADRWDVGGNPASDIINMNTNIWGGRGPGKKVAFTSVNLWNVLRQHKSILDLFRFNGSAPGMATPDMLKGWFDFDELLIGKAWEDTANEGQAAAYSRIWPDVFGIIRVPAAANIRSAFFGATFQDRAAPETDVTFDAPRGTDGGWWARAKISDAHAIVAPDTGFLLTSVIG